MKGLLLRFPGGKSKAVTLSYDDGTPQDKRLIEIMNKYGIKGTFNLVSKWKYDKNIYDGFEVAAHGLDHMLLDNSHGSLLAMQILKDRENLEKDFGRIIRGFAYPGGGYSKEAEKMLGSLGISYARMVKSSNNFELPQNWLTLYPTCHHNSPELMKLAENFINAGEKNIPMMFYLWGHAYEFDDMNNWNVIEEFCKYVGGRDNVWYASNIEIYDYTESFKRLKYSTDADIIYNPSAVEIWFMLDEKLMSIKPGETICTRKQVNF